MNFQIVFSHILSIFAIIQFGKKNYFRYNLSFKIHIETRKSVENSKNYQLFYYHNKLYTLRVYKAPLLKSCLFRRGLNLKIEMASFILISRSLLHFWIISKLSKDEFLQVLQLIMWVLISDLWCFSSYNKCSELLTPKCRLVSPIQVRFVIHRVSGSMNGSFIYALATLWYLQAASLPKQ